MAEWIQCVCTLYLSLLATVPHVKECGCGKNREQKDGTDDAC